MTARVPLRLETGRLLLRQFEDGDWRDLHAYYGDAAATRFTFGHALGEGETWRVMCGMLGHWQLRGYGPYALQRKTDGRVLGTVGFWFPNDWPEPEIKWGLAASYHGQGYAAEAARAVLAAGHRYLSEIRLISLIHVDNAASIRFGIMPFTPFHLGPGMLIKAVLRGSFSLVLFGWAQILIDLQPLVVLLRGEGHLHGLSHTLAGALLIAPVCAVSGRWLTARALQARWLELSRAEREWLGLQSIPGWGVALTSSLIGTVSHVAIDAVIHADLQPFYPWTLSNPALGAWHADQLHAFCIASGAVGLGVFGATQWLLLRRLRR